MNPAATCDTATSLLPNLEPILGVAIALNLAYLNIPAFGYVLRVKQTLKNRLEKIDDNVKKTLGSTAWFKQILDLSNVETLDAEWPSLKRPWIRSPGAWGVLYNVLFYWRLGRLFSVVGTAYVLLLLVLGTAHNSTWTNWSACSFDSGHIGAHLLWCAVVLLWPIFVVMAGGWVCLSAARFVNYQTKSLKENAIVDASRALDESSQAAAVATAQQAPTLPLGPPSTGA